MPKLKLPPIRKIRYTKKKNYLIQEKCPKVINFFSSNKPVQPFSEIQSTSSSRQQRRKALTFSGARVLSGRALSACYSPPSHSYMSWQEKRTLISNQPETCNYSGWLIVWTLSYRKPGTSDDVGVGLILKVFLHPVPCTSALSQRVCVNNEWTLCWEEQPFPKSSPKKMKDKNTPSACATPARLF